MFNLQQELLNLLKKHPDPRKGASGIIEFCQQMEAMRGLPRLGIVSDNKDPMRLGRVRVASELIGPGAVTSWIPVISMYASDKSGFWLLPEIGAQVLLISPDLGFNNPVVLGCIYDEKHRPPKHSTKRAADSKLLQTKNHRLEFIDEEGNQKVEMSTASGKIALRLSNDNGIELLNAEGDIEIDCRKLWMEGKESVKLFGKEGVKLTSEYIEFNAKDINLKSDGKVDFKARNINLNASRGIKAEGRQMAAMGDKVMGFDVHNMIVPSGRGTSVRPLPHPFLGKLVDNLSNNVKINRQNAATSRL